MKLLNDFFVINSMEMANDKFIYNIKLNKDHFIYSAHFPEEHITPGVCVIQIAKELAENANHRLLSVTFVKNVKFLSIVSPEINDEITYSMEFSPCAEEKKNVKILATVIKDKNIFAKISLICE